MINFYALTSNGKIVDIVRVYPKRIKGEITAMAATV